MCEYNVKNCRYGAKGDGVTDDTFAIQACIDDAPEGEVIHFPVGHYKTTKTIKINKTLSLVGPSAYAQFLGPFGSTSYDTPSKINLTGEWGAVIECYATEGAAFEHDVQRYTSLRMDHLVIKGIGDNQRTTAGVRAAYIGGTVEVKMNDVYISNFKIGLDLDWIEYSHFNQIRINGCETGVNCRVNTNANLFSMLNISGCDVGVLLYGAVCNVFTGGSIQGCRQIGMNFTTASSENTVTGIYFENKDATNAIVVDDKTTAVLIQNCHFGADGDHIQIDGVACKIVCGQYVKNININGYGNQVFGYSGNQVLKDTEGPQNMTIGTNTGGIKMGSRAVVSIGDRKVCSC